MRNITAFALALSLAGCASDQIDLSRLTPEEQMIVAQAIAAREARSQAYAAQTAATNRQLMNQATQPIPPMNVPGLVPVQRSDGVWVYCRSVTDNLASCLVK